MFPGANARVYYNEDGEPLGWDYPSEPYEPDWDDLGGGPDMPVTTPHPHADDEGYCLGCDEWWEDCEC